MWAGQIIFNKAGNNGLNLAILHLANHMMEQEDMYGFLSYGDKDTFVSRSRTRERSGVIGNGLIGR